MTSPVPRRPNLLLVVSDQERHRGWLPASVSLPARERLRAEGLEFDAHYTHSSPCSPSRASLFSGRYLSNHGVVDNVIAEDHHPLSTAVPTIGHALRAAGYRTAYLGKWHLSFGAHPDLEAYGFSDWSGDDRQFMGWAGTGVHFDPIIARQAADWLARNGASNVGGQQPWFLTVALVNPHDVMWFPIDQPGYAEAHPEETALVRQLLSAAAWKEGDPLPVYDVDYPEVIDALPANFHDDLFSKPEAHRAWRYDQQHGFWGYLDPQDEAVWRRALDYYVHLHQLADQSLATILAALDESGAAEDTVVVFTSDHGEMCGSHGLRSKGPFAYEEILHVPLTIRAPGRIAPGITSTSLTSSVDLAPTLCALAGVDPASVLDAQGRPSFQGVDLTPMFEDPEATPRSAVLFAQDAAHTEAINQVRYALRGFSDGHTKYVRYYGIGGGIPAAGLWGRPQGTKRFDVGCDFVDQDHELYDLDADPGELTNLAMDPTKRQWLLECYHRLLDLESAHFDTLDPAG